MTPRAISVTGETTGSKKGPVVTASGTSRDRTGLEASNDEDRQHHAALGAVDGRTRPYAFNRPYQWHLKDEKTHVITTPCTTLYNPWRAPQITAETKATHCVFRTNFFNSARMGDMTSDSTKGAKTRIPNIKPPGSRSSDRGLDPTSKAITTAITPTANVRMMLTSHARALRFVRADRYCGSPAVVPATFFGP